MRRLPAPLRALLITTAAASVALASGRPPLIPAPASATLTDATAPADSAMAERLDTTLPREGFRITVRAAAGAAPAGITLEYGDDDGRRYGAAAINRLREAGPIPAGVILDFPRFQHRGLMLDESRHFFGKKFVLRLLDLMADHRLNTFHWHLTDGPGWRLRIAEYPKLTDIGAWRRDKTQNPWEWRSTELAFDGRRPGDYGGFYDEADIREILAHAKSLGITVIPEIECPGHSYAALVAYPETACDPAGIRTSGLRGHDVFCASSPATLALLSTVLDRTAALFPDAPYIHLGGDEVSPLAWRSCPRCTALKEKLRLPAHDALRGVLLQKLAAHLATRGRRVMLWDEAADLPLPSDAALTVWRTGDAAKIARDSGRPRVLCPITHLYFDYGQTADGKGEPPSAGPGCTLSKVYSYEPQTEGETAANLLGIQANLWTEHIVTPQHAERMLLPRLCAFAEVAWSPRSERSEPDFLRRLPAHLARLRRLGYATFEPMPPVDATGVKN